MTSFVNSESQRKLVKNLEIPKSFKDAIFDVWGKKPTIEELDQPNLTE